MSKKVTDWFPANVKPMHIGVYETEVIEGEAFGFQYWNGNNWRSWGSDANDAFRCRDQKSVWQKPKWRGLAEKP